MKLSLPKLLDLLLSEEVVIGIIQAGLIPVLYDTRTLDRSVASYLNSHLPGSIELYSVLALVATFYIFVSVFQQHRELLGMEFGIASVPFLGYVGAIWSYTATQHLSASGAFVISVFYAYFLGRIVKRAREKARMNGGN